MRPPPPTLLPPLLLMLSGFGAAAPPAGKRGRRAPEACRRRRLAGGSPRGARRRWESTGTSIDWGGGKQGCPVRVGSAGSQDQWRGSGLPRSGGLRGAWEPEAGVGWSRGVGGGFQAVSGRELERREEPRAALPLHESGQSVAPSLREAPKASAARLRMSPNEQRKNQIQGSRRGCFRRPQIPLPDRLNVALPGLSSLGWGAARTRSRPTFLAVPCQGGLPPAGTSVLGIVTVPQS